MKLINQLLYFVFTIIILGSVGVWLPLAIDFFPTNTLSPESYTTFPSNLLTYYLSIFFIALVDRVIYIVKEDDYKHKITEVLIFGFIALACFGLTYFAFSKIYQKQYDSAFSYCFWATMLSFIVWWVANRKDEKMTPGDAVPKPKI